VTPTTAASFGSLLPDIRTPVPGAASRALAARLAAAESRNVTYLSEAWPVFWEEARGANVRDADGNVYVDLTAAFGVALLGHGHPAVVDAIREQSGRLLHGMGDVHPPALKVELLERLSAITPWENTRGVLASTGSEAVEIALKTAHLATGRAGVLAFEGGYHGLTLGSLSATERPLFRERFRDRLYGGVAFAPFPAEHRESVEASLAGLAGALERGAANGAPIGAVVVEPVQGRGGARIPPPGFMAEASRMATEAGALVIADEILTGLGRCGALLASERVGLGPDIVCVGKALGGGMPISACLARADVMDAWPASEGEAIHTSTFLGHPAATAAAIAVLDALEAEAVLERVEKLGRRLIEMLRGRLAGLPAVREVRGLGLLHAVELTAPGAAVRVAEGALRAGVLVLPAGADGSVVELTPPVMLTEGQAAFAVEALGRAVEGLG
jgi:4-aminobutyrate aminotransferase-like enzyme